MNFKKIASLALAAAAVGFIANTPAQAYNNNAYMNNLAMQMYVQNQAGAYNPYRYGNYLNLGNYGYGGQTPWSAGALPYGGYGYGGYGYGGYNSGYYNRGYIPHSPFYHHHGWWR